MADLIYGAVELVYQAPADRSLPVQLVFGALDDAVIDDLEFSLAGVFGAPALTGQIHIAQVEPFVFAGILPSPRLAGAVGLIYISGADRSTAAEAAAPYQTARQADGGAQTLHRQSVSIAGFTAPAWQHTMPMAGGTVPTHQTVLSMARSASAPYQWADALAARVGSSHQVATRLDRQRATGWQPAIQITISTGAQHQVARRHAFAAPSTSWQSAVAISMFLAHNSALARPLGLQYGAPYQQAQVPPAGVWVRPPVPDDRCYMPPMGIVPLVFEAARLVNANLVFVCENHGPGPQPGATVVVPIREVYIVINEANLRRVDGNIMLPTISMSMSLDDGSWTWGFSAALPGSVLPLLERGAAAEPVEVEAMVNGVAYRFLIESISRTREFGKNDLRISGRGLAAQLDAPYAPVQNFTNEFDLSAQQLMGIALTASGVALPWTLDFGLTDWLVPAGVFSHTGSHITALTAIAGAAGGYLQPHPSLQKLMAIPRYPALPWLWGSVTPDYELPTAVTSRESIEWIQRPMYDRVFVSGQQAGVLGQVTRAGTAGGLLAPMVTDALITTASAARQRGTSVLSDTGNQAKVQLRLPVLPETGVIPPGKFVRYVDDGETRLGLSRSVSLESNFPEIWQTIGVETHV